MLCLDSKLGCLTNLYSDTDIVYARDFHDYNVDL